MSSKVWIVTNKDLDSMYQRTSDRDFFLWIQTTDDDSDGDGSEPPPSKKKKKGASPHDQKEDEVDEIYEKLKKKHEGGSYTSPQLKLWARICCFVEHMMIMKTHLEFL